MTQDAAATSETASGTHQLTDKQAENWRKVLSTMIGPYAFMMNRSEVQRMRDRFQELADETAENPPPEGASDAPAR